jgi:hypothetical protein
MSALFHLRFWRTLKVADLKELHVCVKFCFKQRKIGMETVKMMKVAFGEQTVGRTQLFEWFSKFKVCVTVVEDSEVLGRPSTCRTDWNVS